MHGKEPGERGEALHGGFEPDQRSDRCRNPAVAIALDQRTLVENAVFVRKLEEAIPLLDAGYHIRMARKGMRTSLIGKDSLIIE